jgi:hypothetical protein
MAEASSSADQATNTPDLNRPTPLNGSLLTCGRAKVPANDTIMTDAAPLRTGGDALI